jgi:hypothetical protein
LGEGSATNKGCQYHQEKRNSRPKCLSYAFHGLSSETRLFHNQTILNGFYPFDAFGDFACFIYRLLRINEAAQLYGALESFNTDLKGFEKIIGCDKRFYLGRDDRIVDKLTGTFMGACRGTGGKGYDQHQKD